MYTIGKLAKRARVNADSIRFYERQGLIVPAKKTASGYRLYTDDALRRLGFIKHAQRCGFSLAEIGELLRVHHGDAASRESGWRLASEKKAEIEQTIAALQAMSDALSQCLDPHCGPGACDELAPDESPFLNALEIGISQQRCGNDRAAAESREKALMHA